MGLRVAQICGLWFWLAFAFFLFVIFHQSDIIIPSPSLHPDPKLHNPSPFSLRPLSTFERMARSEFAWRTSVHSRHEMAVKHPSYPRIPLFPAQKLSDFSNTPYTIWDFFPASWTCPHDIQRVGRLGDGGKWRKQRNKKRKKDGIIIYSFGVNDESTFEEEMLSRIPTSQIHAYDFSVTKFGPQLSPAYASRAHFLKYGLGSTDIPSKTPPFYTLQTLMTQNNHSYIDILKIDIEGSEYTALDSFMDFHQQEGKLPVGQVMIELHLVDDERVHFERFLKWWERLEGFGMRPTWFETNLLAVTLGEGKTDPRCVEYVWVNVKDERSVLLGE
ncbi:395e1552-91dd-4518-9e9b-b36255a8e261 [Sclerotinia trifoliorum]|uniref:395e1552-91dd-4518-9e9b-b36255a8e261 n=1 Tax=Sclerotinia trifoliorum TaxID=28548 RepID=A0A8H2W026_9HELO|nr:395e1552-91dd-4518-9e9b-b36255a8e261 [Sclerotinia trifoliorum]